MNPIYKTNMDTLCSLFSCPNILIFAITSLSVYLLIVVFGAKKTNLPPGPKGWPIFGNLFHLLSLRTEEKNKQFRAWADEYGDIYCVDIGVGRIVQLCNLSLIHEAFVKKSDIFSGRLATALTESFNSHLGLIFANGIVWKKMRKFSTRVLRHFGVGTDKMEQSIKEEAECMLHEMSRVAGTPFNVKGILRIAVSNIISQVVVGHRYEYNDTKFGRFLEAIDHNLQEFGNRSLTFMSLWMVHVPILGRPLKRLYRLDEQLSGFIQSEIDVHRNTIDEANPRDMIDYYLLNPVLDMKDGDPVEPLKRVCVELFEAGSDTTLSTLYWAVLFMVIHPDVQQKVHEELDRVIGMDRRPTMSHQNDCPYTNAVTMEALRFGTTVAQTIEHIAQKDGTIGGYHIPRGTIIYASIQMMNRLQHVWKDRHHFNPDNFLDDNGLFRNIPEFISFGLGPRVCIGERMARMELWLFFTFLLQEYTLSIPPGDPTPGIEARDALIRQPLPFRILVEPRYRLAETQQAEYLLNA